MEEEAVHQSSYISSPISAQYDAFTSLFEYSFNWTLYKCGRARTLGSYVTDMHTFQNVGMQGRYTAVFRNPQGGTRSSRTVLVICV